MKRPVTLPLVVYIIMIILLVSLIAQHQYQELRRDSAVSNINNPATVEHNKLAEIIVKAMDNAFSAGRVTRQVEHGQQIDMLNDIRNDTHQMLELMKNGTD